MDDFRNLTVGMVGFNLILYGVMLLLLWPYYKKHHGPTNKGIAIPLLLWMVFCEFPFWAPDYFHYIWSFESSIGVRGYTHMENVYAWIANNCGSYFVFRLIIWGGAIWLVCLIDRRLQLPLGLFLLIMVGGFLDRFSYARVTLAMSLIAYGSSIIAGQKKSALPTALMGLAIIGCAYFFHKSAPYGIAIALLSLVAYRMGRWQFRMLLLLYPVVIFVFGYLIGQLLTYDSAGSEELLNVDSAQGYLNSESHALGISAILGNTLSWGAFYLTCFIYAKSVLSGKYQQQPKPMKIFGTMAFLTVYTSTAFAFDLGANTFTYFFRLLSFAMIPTAVFLTYCVVYRVSPKTTKLAFLWAVMGVTYQLLYSFYLTSLGNRII